MFVNIFAFVFFSLACYSEKFGLEEKVDHALNKFNRKKIVRGGYDPSIWEKDPSATKPKLQPVNTDDPKNQLEPHTTTTLPSTETDTPEAHHRQTPEEIAAIIKHNEEIRLRNAEQRKINIANKARYDARLEIEATIEEAYKLKNKDERKRMYTTIRQRIEDLVFKNGEQADDLRWSQKVYQQLRLLKQ